MTWWQLLIIALCVGMQYGSLRIMQWSFRRPRWEAHAGAPWDFCKCGHRTSDHQHPDDGGDCSKQPCECPGLGWW